MRLWLSLACALAACVLDDVSTATQPITNGTLTTGDPAVIALVDPQDHVGCTATVIGPHTAITAAHCVADRDPRTLRALFGASLADGTFVAVSDARAHPMFDREKLAHDIAMLTLREPSPAAPLAIDTRAIDQTLVDTMFRVVGYGATASGVGDTGFKREGLARISAVTANELTAVPDPSQPCRGDSGGPALLASDAIAAVVSRGDAACSDHATYARIDVARAILVDPYLAETAPGTAQTGDACLYDGHCAEGPCAEAPGDPSSYVCSQACTLDSECPAEMECASGWCRYPEPAEGGCGCSSNSGTPLWLVTVWVALASQRAVRRRRKRRLGVGGDRALRA